MARRGDEGRRKRVPIRGHQRNHELLFGRNAVDEALRGRRQIFRLLVQDGLTRRERVDGLISEARSRGVPVSLLDLRALTDVARGGNHQGVALEVGLYPYVDLDELLSSSDRRPILLLDHLQDPQNLATLIRTAAAAGVAGVIIQSDRSASVTPAVVHASAGIVERVRVARVTNTGRAISDCKDAGYWAIALEPNDKSEDIFGSELPAPAVLIVGSEGSGVSIPALKAADLTVYLPMPGGIESLNAAVAGSIALYELLRRERATCDFTDQRETSH